MCRIILLSLLTIATALPTFSLCRAQQPAQPGGGASDGKQKDNMESMPGMKMDKMDSMPGMQMNGMGSMSGMNGMQGMGGMDMIREMAMGTTCIMGSPAEPGLLMKLLTGCDMPMGNMGSMNGMQMGGMDSMPPMSMDPMGSMNGMGGLTRPRFSINGWTDISFTASSATNSNLPVGFNYQANQFLLQQNWLRINYAIDENSTAPSFGFRSDWILPGSDYRFTLPRGIWNSQLTANDGTPNNYGIDPIHFYGEAYFPGIAQGLDVKVGRFCMLNGVEMNEATMNLLPSHSYLYLVDPFTLTGILATIRWSDQVVTQAGITTGTDIFFDRAAEATFVGSIQWRSKSKRTIVKLDTVLGSGTFNAGSNFDNRNLFDAVLHHQIGENLYYTLNALYGYEYRTPGIGTAHWYSITQYLTYEWSKILASTARLEFFNDVNGERTGFTGLYTAATAGLWYQPKPWLTLRPEIRYDNSGGRAFEGRHGLFTATADVIFRW